MRAFLFFSIGAFCVVAARGQAVVEHSLATAGSSAAAAGVKGAGESIGGVFRSLSETIDKSGTAKGSVNTPPARAVNTRAARAATTTPPVESKPAAKPVLGSKPIDPSQVTVGLDGDELIQRFGEPVLRFSETRNSQLVERLWYNTTTSSDQLEVRLIGGKVASVRPPAGTKPETPHN